MIFYVAAGVIGTLRFFEIIIDSRVKALANEVIHKTEKMNLDNIDPLQVLTETEDEGIKQIKKIQK